MGIDRARRAARRRVPGPYLALPKAVLNHPNFIALSPYAKALLLDIATQYTGTNNGDLCSAWKVMRKRGWRSEATLHKAKMELVEAGLIFEVRKGARPNKCSLWAITWQDLDYCNGKHEIDPKRFPRGLYERAKIEVVTTPRGAAKTRIATLREARDSALLHPAKLSVS